MCLTLLSCRVCPLFSVDSCNIRKLTFTCFSYNNARFDNDLYGYVLTGFAGSSRVYRYNVCVTGTLWADSKCMRYFLLSRKCYSGVRDPNIQRQKIIRSSIVPKLNHSGQGNNEILVNSVDSKDIHKDNSMWNKS